jgi:hypothetical protein
VLENESTMKTLWTRKQRNRHCRKVILRPLDITHQEAVEFQSFSGVWMERS